MSYANTRLLNYILYNQMKRCLIFFYPFYSPSILFLLRIALVEISIALFPLVLLDWSGLWGQNIFEGDHFEISVWQKIFRIRNTSSKRI